MGDLLGPGIEPMFPALAGGFFTTEPPGTAKDFVAVTILFLFYVFGFLAIGGGRVGGLGVLAPQPGVKPVLPNWKVKCLNHWTGREVPNNGFLINTF